MNRSPNAPAQNTSLSRRRAFLAAVWLAIGSFAAAAPAQAQAPSVPKECGGFVN